MQRGSPSSSAILHDSASLSYAAGAGAQGITQSEDALEKEAQDLSSAVLGYQPSWMREPAGDALDEEYERQKRAARRAARERLAEDDEFGILQEVRQTARLIRRKGLYGSPTARRIGVGRGHGPEREREREHRGEARPPVFGTPSRKANEYAAELLSSSALSSPPPSSPAAPRAAAARVKRARTGADHLAAGRLATHLPPPSRGADDLVDLLPKRSHAKMPQQSKAKAARTQAAKREPTTKKARAKAKGDQTQRKAAKRKAAISDDEDEAGDESELSELSSEEHAEPRAKTKKQKKHERLSSPSLSSGVSVTQSSE